VSENNMALHHRNLGCLHNNPGLNAVNIYRIKFGLHVTARPQDIVDCLVSAEAVTEGGLGCLRTDHCRQTNRPMANNNSGPLSRANDSAFADVVFCDTMHCLNKQTTTLSVNISCLL